MIPLLLACTQPFSDTLLAQDDTAADSGTHDSDPVDTGDHTVADNAEIVSSAFPDTLGAGESATANVTVRNTGNATWTTADGYKLGAIGDSDPLHPGDARVWLGDADAVAPGGSYEFNVDLVGPPSAGTYTTDWQMVHEGIAWFGGTSTHDVTVNGSGDTGNPDTGPDDVPLDLATATIYNSPPDATTWPETARITTIDFNTDGVYIDFTKRDGEGSWPDVPFGAPGDSLEYTLWIVLQIDGRWYTSGCIQYWRGLERNGGPPSGYAANWYYDENRWHTMTGYQPAVGEQVGFFVTAGDARNVTDESGSIVYERSNVVMVPFPSDAGAVYTY